MEQLPLAAGKKIAREFGHRDVKEGYVSKFKAGGVFLETLDRMGTWLLHEKKGSGDAESRVHVNLLFAAAGRSGELELTVNTDISVDEHAGCVIGVGVCSTSFVPSTRLL